MARLHREDSTPIFLRSQHVIGRSRAAHTRLQDAEVSSQHAVLTWTTSDWVVRDLGSRNGTLVNGTQLRPGEERRLALGDVMVLGRTQLTLASDTPPAPAARSGEQLVEGSAELLTLPSEEEPLAIVSCDTTGSWQLILDGRSSPILDGETVVVAGQPWTLMLPEPATRTAKASRSVHTLDDIALRIQVSSDEEHVEVTVLVGGEEHLIKPRAHHYLVLTLARARAADADRPTSEQGWLYTEQLVKMLRISSNMLYVSTHRVRKEIEALGIADASRFIERRAPSRQLRLGTASFEVARM